MVSGAKILVIDDEEDIIRALTIRLNAFGYNVISAVDGLTGLEKIRQERPDLVLLDIMLPKLDGFKVCRMVKFDKNYKSIPIIVITAKATDEDRKTGKEVGADEYLTKPFDPKRMMVLIQQYTEGSKK